MPIFQELDTAPGHELLRVVRDERAGLLGVIAVHSTLLGPSMGGVRRRAYASLHEAVADAVRLSSAMTLKNSAAGLPLGGGKSALVDASPCASPSTLDAFADAVEELGGRYVAAEDIGTTPADMDRLAQRTAWVAGLSPGAGGNGDPSPATAATVFAAIRSAARHRWGSPVLAGRTLGIVGVGKVGGALAELAARAGARVVVADVCPGRAAALARELPRTSATTPDDLLAMTLDVLAPCATGGLLDDARAASTPVEVICGAANNMLADEAVADRLAQRGVLYVPDFLANAGGIIHVGGAFLGWSRTRIEDCTRASVSRTAEVLERAASRRLTPQRVALERARERLDAARG